MRGYFCAYVYLSYNLSSPVLPGHQMRGVFLCLGLSVLQLKQFCPTRTPDERGISVLMFIYLTTKAVMSYQNTKLEGYF